MLWGQDEAIFKQFLVSSKAWIGPNGETALVPKDKGLGIMVSLFQCCKFGILHKISKDVLRCVNDLRRGIPTLPRMLWWRRGMASATRT